MLSLHRIGAGVVALALAFVSATALRAQETVPFDKLLPNDTEMVVVVKVKAILESALVKNAGVTTALKELLSSSEDVEAVLKELNFDPLRDIDQVIVAVSSGSDTDKGLVIVRGKFDVEKLKARAELAAKENKDILTVAKAGGHTYYEVAPPGAEKALFVGIVNSSTLVLGSAKDFVLDALDKEAGKKKTQLKNKDLADLMTRFDPKLTVAVAAPGKTISQSPLLPDEVKDIVGKVQDLTVGVTIDKDLKATVAFTAIKAEDATSLHKTIKEWTNTGVAALSLIANDSPQLESVLDLAKSIKPRLQGKTISIEMTVGGDLIEKLLKNR